MQTKKKTPAEFLLKTYKILQCSTKYFQIKLGIQYLFCAHFTFDCESNMYIYTLFNTKKDDIKNIEIDIDSCIIEIINYLIIRVQGQILDLGQKHYKISSLKQFIRP